MQLGQFLRENKITLREFALRVGVANASVVQKWIAGKRVPRRDAMAAIARETEGKVQPGDFFDLQDA